MHLDDFVLVTSSDSRVFAAVSYAMARMHETFQADVKMALSQVASTIKQWLSGRHLSPGREGAP